MPKILFYENPYTIQLILENKINIIMMVGTCTNRYSFNDEKFAKIIYQTFEIKP